MGGGHPKTMQGRTWLLPGCSRPVVLGMAPPWGFTLQ